MELPGKVHQETSKTSEAENSLIKQSADGLDSSEGKGRSSAVKVPEERDEYAVAFEQDDQTETAESEKASVKEVEGVEVEGQVPKTGDVVATLPHSQGDSQRDETAVRRQSTHGWGGWEYFGWGNFEVDHGEVATSKASAKDTTEPSTTTNMAWKNEAGPEQATGSESNLLPVEAQTLGASVPSSSPIASQSEAEAAEAAEAAETTWTAEAAWAAEAAEAAWAAWAALEEPETELARLFTEMNRQHQGGTFAESSAPLRSRPELQRLRLQMERAWPETSLADAFVNFAGKGSDTLYVGIFARVANDLGLTTEESTAIFRILSGNKSFVQLEDWDGLLLGAVQIAPQVSNVAQQPPAPPNVPEDLGDMGDLSDSEEETSTESTFPGSDSAVQGSEDEPSSPEEDDHSLTQRNDLKALVQELQARLEKSEEEKIRWQREAHRQEEAATELREEMMRLMQDMKYPRIPFDKLELGQKYHGTVKSVLDFGAIVDIGAQSHGLLHISCICKERIENIYDILSEGQQVDVWISGKREDEGKYGLTMVGLSDRRRRPPADLKPFADLPSDEWFNGVVARIVPFGAFVTVTLEDGPSADGLLHVSKIKDGFVDKVENYVSTGQDVQVRIESVDLDSNKMNLSMRSRMIQDPRVQQWWYSFTRPIA